MFGQVRPRKAAITTNSHQMHLNRPSHEIYPEDIQCVLEGEQNRGSIYVGNLEAAENQHTLQKHNIKWVLTACKGVHLKHSHDDVHRLLYLPGEDHAEFNLSQYFPSATDFIEQALQTSNVLVHCMAGVSRSIALVIAYLLRFRKMDYETAYSHVRARRNIMNPNRGFVRQLKVYERQLREASRKVKETPQRTLQDRFNTIVDKNRSITMQTAQDSEKKERVNQSVAQSRAEVNEKIKASQKTLAETRNAFEMKSWADYRASIKNIRHEGSQLVEDSQKVARSRVAANESYNAVYNAANDKYNAANDKYNAANNNYNTTNNKYNTTNDKSKAVNDSRVLKTSKPTYNDSTHDKMTHDKSYDKMIHDAHRSANRSLLFKTANQIRNSINDSSDIKESRAWQANLPSQNRSWQDKQVSDGKLVQPARQNQGADVKLMNADTSKGRLISNKVLGNELHEAAKNSYDSRFKSTVEPLLRFTSNPESAQNYVRHSEYYTSLKNSNYQTNFDRRVSVQGNSGQSETGQVAVRTDNYMDLSKELDERIAKIREKYYAIKFPVFDKSQQQVSQKRGQENIQVDSYKFHTAEKPDTAKQTNKTSLSNWKLCERNQPAHSFFV